MISSCHGNFCKRNQASEKGTETLIFLVLSQLFSIPGLFPI
jgi:hypothetical protein